MTEQAKLSHLKRLLEHFLYYRKGNLKSRFVNLCVNVLSFFHHYRQCNLEIKIC